MKEIGSTDEVNIIVQMDGIETHPETKRYYILKDEARPVAELGEVNMGDPATVVDFANWAMSNYPAENYSLVFMNHGGGWRDKEKLKEVLKKRAVCWDDTNGEDCLYMNELKNALSGLPQRINLVGFDACLMAMTEVAYQLKGCADIMVASEEVEFAPGWPYGLILAELTGTPTMTPKELGKAIVAKYAEFYTASPDEYAAITTQSAIDLSKMEALAGTITQFADSLTDNWDEIANARGSVTAVLDWWEGWEGLPYIDLYHFAQLIADNTSFAEAVMAGIDEAVIANYQREGRPDFHGLSIYFPKTKGDEEYNDYVVDKVACFPQETTWDEFLARYCQAVAPALFTGNFIDTVIDTDVDEKIDWLRLNLEVEVKEEGYYGIGGGLYSGDGIWITGSEYSQSQWLSPGTYNLALDFDGKKIFEKQINGPYRFDVGLYRDYQVVDKFTNYTAHYTYTDFEMPGLFTGTWSDYGTDTNGNQLYDYLVIAPEVLIPEYGYYSISCNLYSSSGDYISGYWFGQWLSKGTYTPELSFNSWDIWKSKIDGPYLFKLDISGPYKNSTLTTHLEGLTGAYTYTQFEMPVVFTGTYTDIGSDTNGNQLYDYLVIAPEVLIPEAGYYGLSGNLYDSSGDTYCFISFESVDIIV